jgi:predicted outer membrane protein
MLLLATAAACAGGRAFAQANLRPDPTPRVPPQPGQGLPAEDITYLQRADRLGRLAVEAGQLAAERAEAVDVKQFGTRMATDHARFQQGLAALAKARNVSLPGQGEAETRAQQALQALRSTGSGQAFERSYLEQQLGVLRALVELHQSEASQATDQELARFAITTLVPVRQELDAANALAGRYGLRSDTLRNPPQY